MQNPDVKRDLLGFQLFWLFHF